MPMWRGTYKKEKNQRRFKAESKEKGGTEAVSKAEVTALILQQGKARGQFRNDRGEEKAIYEVL